MQLIQMLLLLVSNVRTHTYVVALSVKWTGCPIWNPKTLITAHVNSPSSMNKHGTNHQSIDNSGRGASYQSYPSYT